MRKLASIQTITAINPIPNADAIEVCDILGWHVVVKKDDHFQVGNKVVYCEVDSLMPEDNPAFDFLKGSDGKMKRLRTMTMRGQVSQGIVFPLEFLPDGIYEVGQDVTDILNITKYEPPIPACLSGLMKGSHPSFIPKTDETRVQLLQEVLDRHVGIMTYEAEKADGSSGLFYLNDGEFGVCSRNNEWNETDDNSYWKVARKYDIEKKLRTLDKNIALQGELIGEGIQGNKYKLHGQDILFFNAFDIKKYKYLDFEEFIALINNLNLKTVPILATNVPLINNIDELVAKSSGKSVIHKDAHREGIVIRPMVETNDVAMGRLSFKVINPKFLLKYEDA